MSCIGPLEPAGNSCVQCGAVPGFLPQKPPLQAPDGHLQPRYLGPSFLSVPGVAGRVQASVRTGVCSRNTFTLPPLLGGLEQFTPVM